MLSVPQLLLLLLSPVLICHVAAGATEEADRLMNLLKAAIELNNVQSLSGFISADFIYDTCHGVLNFEKFKADLGARSTPPQAISTNWTVRDAKLVDGVLQFMLHYNDQYPVAYTDILYEAKTFEKSQFMLIKGKSMIC